MVSKEEILKDITLASTQKELMDKCENEKLDLLEVVLSGQEFKLDWNNLTEQMLETLIILTSATSEGNSRLRQAIRNYRDFLNEFTLYIDPDYERAFITDIKNAFDNAMSNQVSQFQQTLILASKEAIKKTDLIKSSVMITRREAQKYRKYKQMREEMDEQYT